MSSEDGAFLMVPTADLLSPRGGCAAAKYERYTADRAWRAVCGYGDCCAHRRYGRNHGRRNAGYRDSGIAHVMAVSGMHAGFVQNLTMRLVSRKKIGYPARNLFCAAVLLLFGCIADFSPSVTRAVLQNGYILIAKALKKPCKSQNALCAACALQLAENPYVLYNTGFLLSYAAAASILVIKPALAKQFFFFRKIPDCIGVGLAVNLGMLPLLVTFFNCFSPVGILATIFALRSGLQGPQCRF